MPYAVSYRNFNSFSCDIGSYADSSVDVIYALCICRGAGSEYRLGEPNLNYSSVQGLLERYAYRGNGKLQRCLIGQPSQKTIII